MSETAEIKKPPDKVVVNHPKFIDKWAKRFIHIYKTKDKNTAIEWATGFLSKDAIKPVSVRAKQILGK